MSQKILYKKIFFPFSYTRVLSRHPHWVLVAVATASAAAIVAVVTTRDVPDFSDPQAVRIRKKKCRDRKESRRKWDEESSSKENGGGEGKGSKERWIFPPFAETGGGRDFSSPFSYSFSSLSHRIHFPKKRLIVRQRKKGGGGRERERRDEMSLRFLQGRGREEGKPCAVRPQHHSCNCFFHFSEMTYLDTKCACTHAGRT